MFIVLIFFLTLNFKNTSITYSLYIMFYTNKYGLKYIYYKRVLSIIDTFDIYINYLYSIFWITRENCFNKRFKLVWFYQIRMWIRLRHINVCYSFHLFFFLFLLRKRWMWTKLTIYRCVIGFSNVIDGWNQIFRKTMFLDFLWINKL